MSFKIWFRRWRRALMAFLLLGSSPRKSESQRKKDRERRRKTKSRSRSAFDEFKKKKRKKRGRASSKKAINTLLSFLVTTICILLLPIGVFHWGYSSRKRKKAIRSVISQSSADKTKKSTEKTRKTTDKSDNPSAASRSSEVSHTSTVAQSSSAARMTPTPYISREASLLCRETKLADFGPADPTAAKNYRIKSIFSSAEGDFSSETPGANETALAEPDENIPKSSPRREKDRYIRKRMIIAGSSYCEASATEKLHVGSYIELEPEPTNPYDKDAIKLTFNGEKIGYIAKKDQEPFLTCFKLGEQVYGVITDIKIENGAVIYEYETWFDSAKRRIIL